MSSSAPDAVPKVNDQEKEEERPQASEPTSSPLDNRPASSETPSDPPLTSPPAVATTNGNEETSQQNQQQKKEETSLKVPDVEPKATSTDEKPKPTASTRSKTSSLTKSLSNGRIFNRKPNGDSSKRKGLVTGTAAGSSGGDELELKKKKKKKKRTLWKFIYSCFTPSISHTVLDEGSVKSASVAGAGAGAEAPNKTAKPSGTPAALGEKKAGDHAAEPSGSATLTSTGKPPTPSRRSSALAGDTDIVVPPTSAPELLPLADTEGVTSGAVQPPGSTGLEGEDSESSIVDEERQRTMEEDDDEERLIMNGGNGIPIGPDGKPAPLLPPVAPALKGRKCLVLDLDETLVHSSFKLIPQADYVVPVEIEWQWHNVYVIKRPGVDAFLKRMGELYEVVVFTASLSKYADPVLDKLDVHKVVSHRLFRESCYLHKGNYVKDLSQLGRPIGETIILDNSPASYIFHPNNAVPVSSWFNDPHDTELTDMSPFLADLTEVSDIRGVLDGGV